MLAAALALSAFAAGFLLGKGRESGAEGFQPARTVLLGAQGKTVVVRLGAGDESGNRPMLLTVEGLKRLPTGDYYTLLMTKKGKPVATCGTFNVEDKDRMDVRFSVAYDFENFDGLMLAEYRTSDHKDHPVLRASL